MANLLAEQRVFWRQFRQHFHTTGAIAPSGRFLGRSLARFVGTKPGEPQQILEVGPGTGAVTRHIVRRLSPHDRLDLVELNADFVSHLQARLGDGGDFAGVARQTRVLHQPVEDLPADSQYDLVISGLPLNNFAVADVERILATFARVLKPEGVLSFFEYVAVRPARSLVSGAAERERLRGVGELLQRALDGNEVARDCIWPNLPPAWVHHVRLSGRGIA